MVFCRGCGATLSVGARECPECGAQAPRVVVAEPPRASAPAALAPPRPAPVAAPLAPAQPVLGHHPYDVAAALLVAVPVTLVVGGFARGFVAVSSLVAAALTALIALPLAWGLVKRRNGARRGVLILGSLYALVSAASAFGNVATLTSASDLPSFFRATLVVGAVVGVVQLALAGGAVWLVRRRVA